MFCCACVARKVALLGSAKKNGMGFCIMDAEKRREILLTMLSNASLPVSGSRLSEELGVSRQVIVQDIALLRAGGQDILATPQGYILMKSLARRPSRVFACRHGVEGIEEELNTIVNLGGKVVDVIVEHPLYGELKGLLMLSSQAEVKKYMEKYRASQAEPLSALTKGVHLHTVEAENMEQLENISRELKERGFLLDEV